MATDSETKITRSEARGVARRLRVAVEQSDPRNVALVIRRTLTPDDLASLETLAGLLIERTRQSA